MTRKFSHGFISLFLALTFSLAACSAGPGMPSPTATIAPTAMPTPTSAPTQESAATSSAEEPVVVAFVNDGNIQLWDGATDQIQTIVNADDVIAVKMSDDHQVIAFLRRSVVQKTDLDWFEQSALWAVDGNGSNPRELVSADSLRQRLNAGERDSTNIPQMEWIPRTHQLLFNGWKYLVQAEGESHAVPEGLYLVDTDSLNDTVLVPAGNSLRFVPSPDGLQIALMSNTGLSFINTDGSNLRQDVLTFPEAGLSGPLFPTGVWTQDSHSFLITGSFEMDPQFNIDFTIWRVPVDGSSSSAEPLATVNKSHPGSVTFSPDGRHAASLQATEGPSPEIAGWFITPLAAELGPLAIPYRVDVFYPNLHWSPAGAAFVIKEQELLQLCPDATNSSEVCGDPIHLGSGSDLITSIQWIDSARFLFAGIEPATLALGKLDGTLTPIIAWAEGESESWSFSSAR